MKVLVTGVGGFIGSSIAEKLLANPDNQVLGLDCLTDYYPSELKLRNIERLRGPAFRFIRDNLCTADLDKLVKGTDIIIHQAGQPGVRGSWGESFITYAENNVVATQRLLEAAHRARSSPKVIYASSSSIYGDAGVYPVTEDTLPAPKSPYGVTKLAAEHLVSLYAKNYGLRTTSLRYFTVYGPRQRPDMAFTRFVSAALRGDEMHVFGTGNQVREFTYVSDIVDANMKAMTADTPPGSVINLSGGTSIALIDAIETIRELANSNSKIVFLDAAQGDVERTGGCTRRASDLLQWKPKVDIRTGLRMQIEWVQNQTSSKPVLQ